MKLQNAKRMRRAGFTDHREGYWYYSAPVMDNVTFDLTVDKSDGSYETLVMDESFGQPAYYGQMISVYRELAIARVNVILHELERKGFAIEFDHAEYGVDK